MNKFPNKKYFKIKDFFEDYSKELSNCLAKTDIKLLTLIKTKLKKKYQSKNKIFVCGNGGSAAIANHFECDHKKILSETKKINPRIISLCSNNSLISAISNDISYDNVFSKQLEYLSNSSDTLITISASGNSENIIQAIKFAKKKKMFVISMTGFGGGRSKKLCDINLHVNSKNYGVIENIHHAYMNIISQYIKIELISKKNISINYF